MFTGIVVTVGEVTAIIPADTALRFQIAAPALIHALNLGDSVCCEGACLTVEAIQGNEFTVCAVRETLDKTQLRHWAVGSAVNLEPALQAGTPLGGHFVLGHVDGVGIYESFLPLAGGGGEWKIRLPKEMLRYCVVKGSLTVCGVSLTLAAIAGDVITIALIPHTLGHTTLGLKSVGDSLNIEVDVLGKHIERLLAAWNRLPGQDDSEGSAKAGTSSLTLANLSAWGYAPAVEA